MPGVHQVTLSREHGEPSPGMWRARNRATSTGTNASWSPCQMCTGTLTSVMRKPQGFA